MVFFSSSSFVWKKPSIIVLAFITLFSFGIQMLKEMANVFLPSRLSLG